MSSFGRKNKMVRLLKTLVGIETFEALGLSLEDLLFTTENQIVTTTSGDFITHE